MGKYQYNILIFFLASQFNNTFYERTPQFCPHYQVSRWAGFYGRCNPLIPLSWFWSTWCSKSFLHTTPICIKAASKFGCTASVCTLNCYLSIQRKYQLLLMYIPLYILCRVLHWLLLYTSISVDRCMDPRQKKYSFKFENKFISYNIGFKACRLLIQKMEGNYYL